MILLLFAVIAATWATIASAIAWLALPPSPMQITPEEAVIWARLVIVFLGCAVAAIISGMKESE